MKYEKGYDYGYRLPEKQKQNCKQEIFEILKPRTKEAISKERRENTYFRATEKLIGEHNKPKVDEKEHHEIHFKKTSFKELFEISKNDINLLMLNLNEGQVNSYEFGNLMKDTRVFDLICKNLYQEILNQRYTDKIKQEDPDIYIMSYEKFRSLADKMTLNMFHKLRKGKMTFQQFRSHVFQDENNLEFYCIDDLKEIYGPELFEDDPKIKQLIDNVCEYRNIGNKKK